MLLSLQTLVGSLASGVRGSSLVETQHVAATAYYNASRRLAVVLRAQRFTQIQI